MSKKHKQHHEHEEHGHGGGEHGGEENWLVSYADMMTLLVGFFVILLSFSQIDQEKFEEAKKSVSEKFGGNYETTFGEIADRIKEALDKAGKGDQFVIKSDDSGIEISFLGTAFFDSGSVEVKNEAIQLFDILIKEIKNEIANLNVLIEGHTDDVPLNGTGTIRNNWELSSIRACRVLDYFVTHGFDKLKMTAVGYGEARPLVPNRDQNGISIPINQSKNRRVIIKLSKAEVKSL